MKTILTILFLCFLNVGFSQFTLNSTAKKSTPIVNPTNHERYGRDYVLTNYTFVNQDSTILFKLNLDDIEIYRLDSENIIVTEPNTLMNITLFSRNSLIADPHTHDLIKGE